MNCDFCSKLTVQVRTNVNHFRQQLCKARIEADIERDKYTACCRNAETSLAALTEYTQASRSKNATSKSSAELGSLLARFMEDSTAVSAQLNRLRIAESQVKYYETSISQLGIWLVHIPEHTVSKSKEPGLNHIGHKRKDSGVDQID